jgi:hypothetical protein
VRRFALLRCLLIALVAVLLAPACSLGQGNGSVCGWLDVPNCWAGGFRLSPDFYAAIPTNSSALEIRVQNGIDYETYSDGLLIVVDDAGAVRGDPTPSGMTRAGLLGQALPVSLPAGVTAPGVPIQANPNPALIHATVYLNRTCRTQNVALYATTCAVPSGGQVAVGCNVDGSGGLTFDASGADATTSAAGADAATGAGDAGAAGGLAQSTITFRHLFDGNINESNATQRLTDADFDLYLADPREGSPGGVGPPAPCRGHLTGSFHFYFERGRPAQPFP